MIAETTLHRNEIASSYRFWRFRSHGDDGLLCARKAQPVVHFGICWVVRASVGLRVSPGRLAVRGGRGHLVHRGNPAMVGCGKLKLNGEVSLADAAGSDYSIAWRRTPQLSRRNAGYVATVSARVLIIRLPIAGSLAHEGTRPQTIRRSSRVPSRSKMPGVSCVGATLNRGALGALTR